MFPLNVVAASALGDRQSYTLTAADGDSAGIGYTRGVFGSFEPQDNLFNWGLVQIFREPSAISLLVQVLPDNIPDTDDAFREIIMSGVFSDGQGTQTFKRADHTGYLPGSGAGASWAFSLTLLGVFVVGNTYDIEFKR